MKTSLRYSSLIPLLLSFMLFGCTLASTEPIPTQTLDAAVEAQRNEPVFIDARSDPSIEVQSVQAESVQALSGGPPQAQSGYVQPAPVQPQYPYQPQPQPVYQNIYYIAPTCVPRYDWSIYYVRQGDTLARIASWYGTTAATLAYANCISNPNLIYTGQAIRVPYYNPPKPPHHPYPPHPYPPTYPPPPPTWTPLPPTAIPPVIIGTALSINPFAAVNNNVYTLNPGDLVTFSWNSAFPTATIQVAFEMIAPTGGSTVMGIDSNLGDGATILWNAVPGLQGTVRAIAAFSGGYPPQASDSVYVIVPGP